MTLTVDCGIIFSSNEISQLDCILSQYHTGVTELLGATIFFHIFLEAVSIPEKVIVTHEFSDLDGVG